MSSSVVASGSQPTVVQVAGSDFGSQAALVAVTLTLANATSAVECPICWATSTLLRCASVTSRQLPYALSVTVNGQSSNIVTYNYREIMTAPTFTSIVPTPLTSPTEVWVVALGCSITLLSWLQWLVLLLLLSGRRHLANHWNQLQGQRLRRVGQRVCAVSVRNATAWPARQHWRCVLRPRWQADSGMMRCWMRWTMYCRHAFVQFRVQCRVPAGVGAGYTITVIANNVFGLAFGYIFSYEAPVVTAVTPVSESPRVMLVVSLSVF